MQAEVQQFGWSLYDEAFLAIISGDLDLPARALRVEGHFSPDGTGYLYHGLSPLLTRFVLAPFVDVASTPIAPISIWFWAGLGSTFYHRAFFIAARSVWPNLGHGEGFWFLALGAAIWVGGPGLLLSSNLSVYQEPIAVAYALAGGVVWLWARSVVYDKPLREVLVAIAVFAAICVHARPHVALGLYFIVIFASISQIRCYWRRAIGPVVLALSILGIGGASYLGYNALRFDDAAMTHGTFEDSHVQHAVTFWEFESPNSDRASAFTEHGRFNVRRILPNAAMYILQPPQTMFPDAQLVSLELHSAATRETVGKIRIETPGAGMLALWTSWSLLAVAGTIVGARTLMPWLGLLLGTGIVALIICAYATITLRYHIDLWPFVATFSILGIVKIAPHLAASPLSKGRSIVLIAAGLAGVLTNAGISAEYRGKFLETPGSRTAVWNYETCVQLAARKSFSSERIEEICREPRVLYVGGNS